MPPESVTNGTEKVVRNFRLSGKEVLLVFALILALSTKSYVIQEMLFWLAAMAFLFALMILVIGVALALRQIGRSGYSRMKVRVARITAYRRNRLSAHDAMGRLPYR